MEASEALDSAEAAGCISSAVAQKVLRIASADLMRFLAMEKRRRDADKKLRESLNAIICAKEKVEARGYDKAEAADVFAREEVREAILFMKSRDPEFNVWTFEFDFENPASAENEWVGNKEEHKNSLCAAVLFWAQAQLENRKVGDEEAQKKSLKATMDSWGNSDEVKQEHQYRKMDPNIWLACLGQLGQGLLPNNALPSFDIFQRRCEEQQKINY